MPSSLKHAATDNCSPSEFQTKPISSPAIHKSIEDKKISYRNVLSKGTDGDHYADDWLNLYLFAVFIYQISCIESRPEGQRFTSSKAPILELLGQCQRTRLATKYEKSLWFIRFSDRTKRKLDRIIERTDLVMSELDCSCREVSGAILQSFPTSENDVYLLSDVANLLLENFSIDIDEQVFGSQSQRLKIAREFLNEMDHRALSECVSLLEALASQEEPPIQDIIDSGAVFALLEGIHGLTSVRYLLTLVEANMVHMCEALKHIASTSVNTREKLLNSDIIGTLLEFWTVSIFTSNMKKHRSACIDTLKSIFCNKDMPHIDLNSLVITNLNLARICCTKDLSLVDFVISVLDTQIKRQQLLGEQSVSSYSSFVDPLRKLMSSPSTELAALKMLSHLSELDVFGSIATDHRSQLIIHSVLIQYLLVNLWDTC